MRSPLTKLSAAAAAFALCVSSTAAAAVTAVQPINPLVAVSLFGTQASAQAVCSQGASSAVAAGAAAAAQAQPNCVLPATDVPPPVAQGPAPQPPPPVGTNYGINWLLLALGVAALLGGISTLFEDDDDIDAISP